MKVLLQRRTFFVLCILITLTATGVIFGQTPAEQQWLSFMVLNHGAPRFPEDEIMGLLADRRNADPLQSSVLAVCDRALTLIAAGRVPENLIHPAVRVPMSMGFQRVLEGGGKELVPRYALPKIENGRITVPVRLYSGELTGSGSIYLSRWKGEWFIDQWALDLSIFPTGNAAGQ